MAKILKMLRPERLLLDEWRDVRQPHQECPAPGLEIIRLGCALQRCRRKELKQD